MRNFDLVPLVYNLILDLHLELIQRLQLMHAPRKIASRIESSTTSAVLAVGVAAAEIRVPFHLKQARERIEVVDSLLRALRDEHFVTPLMYLWARRLMDQIFIELKVFDPKKKLVPLRAPINKPPPPMLN